MEDRIKQRIAELIEARARYKIEADAQLLAYDAVIGELQALLLPQDGVSTTKLEVTDD